MDLPVSDDQHDVVYGAFVLAAMRLGGKLGGLLDDWFKVCRPLFLKVMTHCHQMERAR